MPKVVAVIPCHNEEASIHKVVKESLKYVDAVVVCNDRSTDRTSEIAKKAGAKVVGGWWNDEYAGVGWATCYGISEAIKRLKPDILVTLDGDGQHDPIYIPVMIDPIKKKQADYVIGVRDGLTAMPFDRRIANRILYHLSNILSGNKLLDVSCGYRAFTPQAICGLLIEESGFNYVVETAIKARGSSYRVCTAGVPCIYEDCGILAKGDEKGKWCAFKQWVGNMIAIIKWRLILNIRRGLL